MANINHYRIRFNKTRGQPGRGTVDHVWRVFENGNEYLVKHIKLNVPSYSEQTGEDWNISCDGIMEIDKETSTVIIKSSGGKNEILNRNTDL